jgi:hypothetical protein
MMMVLIIVNDVVKNCFVTHDYDVLFIARHESLCYMSVVRCSCALMTIDDVKKRS